MNNLSKVLLITMLLSATMFYGQKRNPEKIKSLKIAYITEHIDLSPKEAQSFWPIYNEYEENREALRKRARTQVRSKIKNAAELTEKESIAILDRYINIEAEEEALDKAFLKKISKVISSKKTLLLIHTREEFKRKLINEYRKKNKQ